MNCVIVPVLLNPFLHPLFRFFIFSAFLQFFQSFLFFAWGDKIFEKLFDCGRDCAFSLLFYLLILLYSYALFFFVFVLGFCSLTFLIFLLILFAIFLGRHTSIYRRLLFFFLICINLLLLLLKPLLNSMKLWILFEFIIQRDIRQ